jgi:hypothetical protein
MAGHILQNGLNIGCVILGSGLNTGSGILDIGINMCWCILDIRCSSVDLHVDRSTKLF